MQLSMLGNDMVINSAKGRYMGFDHNPGAIFMGADGTTTTADPKKGIYDTLVTPTVNTINTVSPTLLSWYSTVTGKTINPQAPADGGTATGSNKSIMIAAGVVGAAVLVFVVMKKKRRR
jgi:LPXTG-motif cell wall-anchored protein